MIKLNKNQERILSYLNKINNPYNLSLRELARRLNLTPNTIINLYRKLNYKSYKEFIFNYSFNQKQNLISKGINCYEELFNEELKLLKKLKEQLDFKAIDKLVSLLGEFKRVDIIAYDLNNVFASYLAHKLISFGKLCSNYNDLDTQLSFALNASKEDNIVILLSRSAITKRIKVILRQLKEKNINTILITSNTKLKNLCTLTINLPTNINHNDQLYFYSALKFLLDCIIVKYYQDNKDKCDYAISNYERFYRLNEMI